MAEATTNPVENIATKLEVILTRMDFYTQEIQRIEKEARDKIDGLRADMTRIETKLDTQIATVADFPTVKKVVYGGVGFILMAVVGALIALVVP